MSGDIELLSRGNTVLVVKMLENSLICKHDPRGRHDIEKRVCQGLGDIGSCGPSCSHPTLKPDHCESILAVRWLQACLVREHT